MNIFVLDPDPIVAAQMQCDRHVVKMILESAQMLSTAHRILDGIPAVVHNPNGRKTKRWIHHELDDILYHATHYNHPCSVWARTSQNNYYWLYMHFRALCREYTYRYEKVHLCETKLLTILANAPRNLTTVEMTPFALAMGSEPQLINTSDPVGSYRAFYRTKQAKFSMIWTKRNTPDWFFQ